MIDQDFSAEDLRLSLLQEAATDEEAFWIEVASALLPGALEPIPLRVGVACPGEETLIAWVSGSLPASKQADVANHLKGCAACAARRAAVAEALLAAERAAAGFVPPPPTAFASLMARWEAERPSVLVPAVPLWERLPFTELRRLVEQGQAEALAAWESLRRFGERVRAQVEQALAGFTPPAPAFVYVPVRGEGEQPPAIISAGQLRIVTSLDFSGGVRLEEGPEIAPDGRFRLTVALTDAEGQPDLAWDGWRMQATLVLPETATGEPEVRLPLAEAVIQNSSGSVQVAGVAEALSLPGGSLPAEWVELTVEEAL
jgi:hypothetical protein